MTTSEDHTPPTDITLETSEANETTVIPIVPQGIPVATALGEEVVTTQVITTIPQEVGVEQTTPIVTLTTNDPLSVVEGTEAITAVAIATDEEMPMEDMPAAATEIHGTEN